MATIADIEAHGVECLFQRDRKKCLTAIASVDAAGGSSPCAYFAKARRNVARRATATIPFPDRSDDHFPLDAILPLRSLNVIEVERQARIGASNKARVRCEFQSAECSANLQPSFGRGERKEVPRRINGIIYGRQKRT
jgi:hypothetical protein